MYKRIRATMGRGEGGQLDSRLFPQVALAQPLHGHPTSHQVHHVMSTHPPLAQPPDGSHQMLLGPWKLCIASSQEDWPNRVGYLEH